MTMRTTSHSKYLLIGIKSGMTDKELLEGATRRILVRNRPGSQAIQFTAKELAEFRAAQNPPISVPN